MTYRTEEFNVSMDLRMVTASYVASKLLAVVNGLKLLGVYSALLRQELDVPR